MTQHTIGREPLLDHYMFSETIVMNRGLYVYE
jgi:hypothetical protein